MPIEEYEELDRLLSEGKGTELLERLKDMVFIDCNDGYGYYYEAMAQALLKEYEEANNMIDIAIGKQPQNAKFHAAKAEILISLQQFNLAEEEYKKSIYLDVNDPVPWFFYGKYLIEQKQKKKAGLHCMYQAVKLQPDHTGILFQMGKYYMQFGLKKEAKKMFRQILIQDPEYQEANASYGHLLIEEGMPGAALEYVKKAFSSDWSNREVEKDFFRAYKAIHPKKGIFWQITLWMNRIYVKGVLSLGVFLVYALEKAFTLQFFLYLLLWIYSFVGPAYFYNRFQRECYDPDEQ